MFYDEDHSKLFTAFNQQVSQAFHYLFPSNTAPAESCDLAGPLIQYRAIVWLSLGQLSGNTLLYFEPTLNDVWIWCWVPRKVNTYNRSAIPI